MVPDAGLVRLRVVPTASFTLDGFVLAGRVVRIRAVRGRAGGLRERPRPGPAQHRPRRRSRRGGRGMLLGALARSLWAVLLGYAATGPGLANLFPVAVERAGALAGPGGVATASTLGYGSTRLSARPRSAPWRTGSVSRPR